MIPEAALSQYKLSQRLQAIAQLKARKAWALVQPDRLSESWEVLLRNTGLVEAVSSAQLQNATAGASYSAQTLAEQGLYEAPESFVNPAAFAGIAADGRSLESLLYAPVPFTKKAIGGGADPMAAKVSGGKFLEMLVKTSVADAGRGAAGVDIATRRGVGYVRLLNPPSCARCSVLAGRFYRWNAGFDRHPRCDCIHVASTEGAVSGGRSEGLIHDPYEYFSSLSKAEQDKVYTEAGAQAIRDGADLFQVVNSRRGMKPGGLITTEGTSRRGAFGAGRGPRLTPEGIYAQGLPRDQTLKLLEKNGYLLPGGQQAEGVIRGQREGYGALGRGGTRVGARQEIERVRATGERSGSRYTMTAAERRVLDARLNWEAVRAGRNPFTNAKAAKVTPEVAARVERDYQKYILGY